jgi:hypothetical protein
VDGGGFHTYWRQWPTSDQYVGSSQRVDVQH